MTKKEMQPRVVGPREAARLLNEGINKIYNKINSGELPSYLDGRLRRIPVAAIDALIARKLQEGRRRKK